MGTPGRWRIAGFGTLLQMCLGSVYAWSYFQEPLVRGYGWTNAQVAWAFSLAIFFLGLSAAAGGMILPRFGPRLLATSGSVLYGCGYFLAALALHNKSLLLLWLGFGVIGGIGLGLGYVTPVATVVRWFPDKKGLVTGMVIMGFGFGALLMSKVIAPALSLAFAGKLPLILASAGGLVGGLGLLSSWFLKNPPDPASSSESSRRMPLGECEQRWHEHIFSRRFAVMWLIFFCNITAGIAIIGFQSPLLQDRWRLLDPTLSQSTLAAYGATLIAVSSVFNGLGRLLWGWVSDSLGQVTVFGSFWPRKFWLLADY